MGVSRVSGSPSAVPGAPPSVGLHALLVWLGGGTGALARYGVQQFGAVSADSQLWLLLAINTFGCFFIGLLTHRYVVKHQSPLFYSFAITGVLGGFTSFSAYVSAMHSWQQRSDLALAVTYGVVTVVVCLVGCVVGQVLASRSDRLRVETVPPSSGSEIPIPDDSEGSSTC